MINQLLHPQGMLGLLGLFQNGIKVLPHIINAVVLTSALSAANLGLIHASRSLFGLASNGQAPKIFLKLINMVFLGLELYLLHYFAIVLCQLVPLSLSSITSSNLLVN